MANAQMIDPLADLKAEIAAEAGAQPPVDPVLEETKAEEAALAAEEERVAAEEAAALAAEPPAEGKKKAKKSVPEAERMVPVERMNEYAVRVRQLEKEKEELEAKLNPPPPPPPQAPKTEDQIRAEARAMARLEIQLEQFSAEGNARYTQKVFDKACDKIAGLIAGPSNLVALAIEATGGSPKDASVAIMALGSMDAPEITAILAQSQIRQAAQLAKWATARTKRAAVEEEPAPRRKQVIEEEDEDEEITPLRPIRGSTTVNESLGDDVPAELWFDRFEKQIMNKKLPH